MDITIFNNGQILCPFKNLLLMPHDLHIFRFMTSLPSWWIKPTCECMNLPYIKPSHTFYTFEGALKSWHANWYGQILKE
jgi:hypothetical protein